MSHVRYISPLRYPGGKARMAPTVRAWINSPHIADLYTPIGQVQTIRWAHTAHHAHINTELIITNKEKS